MLGESSASIYLVNARDSTKDGLCLPTFFLRKFFKAMNFIDNMADNKIQMPSSGGGIVRYYDDSQSKIHISPVAVVVMAAVIAIFEIALFYFYG